MKNDNLAISRNSENEAVFHREKNVSTSSANHCKVIQEGFELLAQFLSLYKQAFSETI